MPPSRTGSREPAAAGSGPGESSWIGRCFEGRYRIEAQLGNGGVGHVYRARHLRLDRPVALKVLRKQHNERWVSRQRFEREARSLGQLSHPHIVAVTDSGIDVDVPFLVMELLNGQDLAAALRGGPLEPALACRYLLELLDGLGFVHEHGLVHRDIKPGNVFLERSEHGVDRVKLLDFGLARMVVPSTDASVSRFGEMLGTPAYMAPEQITGEAVDARTDVYAVGLLLFEMIAGRRAFAGSEPEILSQQLAQPVPRLPRARQVSRLDDVIQRAVHKEASQRFPDARAMAAALATAAGELRASAASPSSSVPARAPGRARRSRAGHRGPLARLLRAGAVLVSCLAVMAIVLASSVIYLLDSPGGDERRVLLQRVLSSLFEPESPLPGP